MTEAFNPHLYYTAYGAFALLAVLAAGFDVWKLIIPNAIAVGVAALFCVMALLSPGEIDWISHIGAAAAVFVAGILLHRLSVLGAGDIKFLTAIALWAGFKFLPVVLVHVALAGGALALVVLMFPKGLLPLANYFPAISNLALVRAFWNQKEFSYGLAISIGAISATYDLPRPGLLY